MECLISIYTNNRKIQLPYLKEFKIIIVFLLGFVNMLYSQTNWKEHPDNPVFDRGIGGSWDDATVFDASVIQVNDTLKMWYTGNSNTSAFDFKIGYAWSLDGINWTRSDQPVLEARQKNWDSYGLAAPEVILDSDTLKMWYLSTTSTNPGKEIGYATSLDGINWNRLDYPVFTAGPMGEWDESFLLGAGAIIKEDKTYKMWYLGGKGTFPNPAVIQTGFGTSVDGINWEKYNDSLTASYPYMFSDPVLRVGTPGSFDDIRALGEEVHSKGSGYEMWYTGEKNNPRIQAIGYAISPNEIRWNKYNKNPVLNSSGWAYEFSAPSVIKDQNQYRMWFTGFSPGPYGRIGYATSDVKTGIKENEELWNNDSYRLYQNYPNPFNPKTKIKYSIPSVDIEHSLKVYGILGNEIANFYNEEKSAGYYEVEFDGSNLSSGIYFYQLKTSGKFLETKKMIIMK